MDDLPVVVCYGDSNTYGAIGATDARFPRDVRWPGVVARELAGRASVVEEGLNGRTTIWDDPFIPWRNGRDYLLPCLESHAPVAVLVIMLGTNDLKAIHRLGAAEIAAGAGSLVDVARASGAGPGGGPPAVLLVSPPHLGEITRSAELWGFAGGAETSRRLAPLYEEAAAQCGAAFLDAAALVEPDASDGVHLGPSEHAVLGRAVAAAVARLLPAAAAVPAADAPAEPLTRAPADAPAEPLTRAPAGPLADPR